MLSQFYEDFAKKRSRTHRSGTVRISDGLDLDFGIPVDIDFVLKP